MKFKGRLIEMQIINALHPFSTRNLPVKDKRTVKIVSCNVLRNAMTKLGVPFKFHQYVDVASIGAFSATFNHQAEHLKLTAVLRLKGRILILYLRRTAATTSSCVLSVLWGKKKKPRPARISSAILIIHWPPRATW